MTEEKKYLTFEEAAEFLGKKRASIYNYIKELGIETHKFKLDRRSYLAIEDVKRIKEVLTGKPWIAGEKSKKDAA